MIEVIVLSSLLVLTNVFWAYLFSKLTNKLMSRNFYEYHATVAQPKKKEPELVIPERDEWAEAQAQELNAIMNIG